MRCRLRHGLGPLKSLLKIALILAFLVGVGYGTQRYASERKAAASPAVSTGAPGGGPAGATKRPPIPAEAIVVRAEPIDFEVPTVGTFAPNESVELCSEQNRRLKEVLVEEGAWVEKDAVLFRLDAEDLHAQLRELEARRELASSTEKRLANLLSQNAIPQANYDEAASNVRVLDAQIDYVRTQLSKTEIRAPFPGTVGMRRVSEGAWLTPDRVITTLTDTRRIKVDFKVPERYAPAIRPGSTFRFRPEGSGDWRTGTVVAIEPTIDPSTRSLVVRGIADNADGALRPGGFSTVSLTIDSLGAGVLVPSQAIVPTARGHSVFVVEQGRAKPREVTLGQRNADSVQVLSGIRDGDTVLVSNLLRVRPDSQVEIKVVN